MLWQIGCGKKGSRKNSGLQELDFNRSVGGGTITDRGRLGRKKHYWTWVKIYHRTC